jgi:hypothetical protein
MWALLLLTLPTQPNAVRVRVWRSLKAMGCAALRDGAYALPAEQAARFDSLAAEVREHGGAASVLALAPRDEPQRQEIVALFDRAEAYAAWHATVAALHRELGGLTEVDARRRLRSVADALDALRAIDYYPGPAAAQAEAELQALRTALDARLSRGEPVARAAHDIARLDVRRFEGKLWATRARPWVDRLACAWLIRRYVDAGARFVWLDEDPPRTPRGAIGFDYDGARFTHVGARVTFEVMAASFGLDADPALERIARNVHYLDAGGIPAAEAAGLEAVLTGLRAMHEDDDALLDAACVVFDALHATAGPA